MSAMTHRTKAMELYGYNRYKPTKSCYLDGRYVNIVLEDIEQFVPEPIHIKLVFNKHKHIIKEEITSGFIKLRKGMNIIRVVINTTYTAHSALLWLNTIPMTAEYTDVKAEGSDHIHSRIPKLLEDYVNTFGDFTFSTAEYAVPLITNKLSCEKQGYCNAYVIAEALSWHTGEDLNIETDMDVLKFVGAIETLYGKYLNDEDPPEVEYFGVGLGLGLGLLGGVAIGSAVASSNRRRYY